MAEGAKAGGVGIAPPCPSPAQLADLLDHARLALLSGAGADPGRLAGLLGRAAGELRRKSDGGHRGECA